MSFCLRFYDVSVCVCVCVYDLFLIFSSSSVSVDSSKDLSSWLDCLSLSIRNALSCSKVAMRILENPCNKVCGDCNAANPEWASVNLLVVICQACAGMRDINWW